MRPTTVVAFVAVLSASLALPACGPLEEQDELIEAASLEGLDLPADYAGGSYVRVKGTLTRGRTRSGAYAGRDTIYGYTITARKNELLRVRGVAESSMSLVAIYGPQRADGAWGPQRAKAWTTFTNQRTIPTVGYTAPSAGKYLVVIRGSAAGQRYALTACDGECRAKACGEIANSDDSAVTIGGFLSVMESDVALERYGNYTARSGSCADQPRTCPSTRAPVCYGNQTFDNVCKVRAFARSQRIGAGLSLEWVAANPGACPR